MANYLSIFLDGDSIAQNIYPTTQSGEVFGFVQEITVPITFGRFTLQYRALNCDLTHLELGHIGFGT